MIKILFYIDDLRAGGAEKVLCNLVNNMDQSKFDITVHTTYKGDASLLVQGIHYKYVYANHNKLSEMTYRIEAQLGLFYRLHLKGYYDIEVAYLECGPTKVMASSTNKKAVKFAWVHCDLEKKMGDVRSFVSKTRGYYKKYDSIICVSEDVKKTFIKLFGMKGHVTVLHNTIDDKQILQMAEMQTVDIEKPNAFTFVSMGRLTDQKNYILLLECANALIKDGLNINIWIIGEGEERDNLEHYVNDNNMNDHIRFWGYQNNPYPIVRAADAYVCSSKYEGYSTAVIEALLLGKPVLTTDCTGMKEILGDSKYGMIVPVNKSALKEGIKQFIFNIETLNIYQSNSIQRGKQLSGKITTKETEDYIISILNDKVNA